MATSSSALPLKVNASVTPPKPADKDSGTPSAAPAKQTPTMVANPTDISSPHELTAYVESLLGHLDAKFDDMSTQILDRMKQMSSRVDSLEASIQDIINGDIAATPSLPQSPSPLGPGTPGQMPRRTGSGMGN